MTLGSATPHKPKLQSWYWLDCVLVSTFQFIASLASSLAWPAVALALGLLVWFKRADLVRLSKEYSGDARRPLRRLRAGPLELEWDKLIEKTADTVEGIDSEAPVPADESTIDIGLANSPVAVVLEAFARVENSLRHLLTVAGRPSSGGIAALSQDAWRNGLISEEVFDAIYNLNRLRSTAAKRVGAAEISTDQAKEYTQLASRVLAAIQQSANNFESR
jgi:hypothetical protein